MATDLTELPTYEDLIERLNGKLMGLSAVHRGLGDAAETLVLASREFDETKRSLETLAASNEGTLAEVMRLRPGELAATLDTRFREFKQDTSQELRGLAQQVSAAVETTTALQAVARDGIAHIESRVDHLDDALPTRLSGLRDVLITASTADRQTMHSSLAALEQRTGALLGELRADLAAVSSTVVAMQSMHQEQAKRDELLIAALDKLQRQQLYLNQQLTAVKEEVTNVRHLAAQTQTVTSETPGQFASIAGSIFAVQSIAGHTRDLANDTRNVVMDITPSTRRVLDQLDTDIRDQNQHLGRQVVVLSVLVGATFGVAIVLVLNTLFR